MLVVSRITDAGIGHKVREILLILLYALCSMPHA